MTLSPAEKRALTNLHLSGAMGDCGALTRPQRRALLQGLLQKGLLRDNGTLTPAGVAACLARRHD